MDGFWGSGSPPGDQGYPSRFGWWQRLGMGMNPQSSKGWEGREFLLPKSQMSRGLSPAPHFFGVGVGKALGGDISPVSPRGAPRAASAPGTPEFQRGRGWDTPGRRRVSSGVMVWGGTPQGGQGWLQRGFGNWGDLGLRPLECAGSQNAESASGSRGGGGDRGPLGVAGG